MHRFTAGSVEPLGEREVGVIAATSQLARDGHVLLVDGLDLTNYRKNPIVLANHDPSCPVATATAVGVRDGALVARIEFAPAGVSTVADQTCALVKSGILRGVSIGFDPIEAEPLDPKAGRYGGMRILHSELCEISFVSIPADVGAGVTERSALHAATIARALPRLPAAAIQRAAARVQRGRTGAILNPTMHVWVLQQQRRREEADRAQAFSYAQRQLDLARLRPR